MRLMKYVGSVWPSYKFMSIGPQIKFMWVCNRFGRNLLLALATNICFKKFILSQSVSHKIYALQKHRPAEMWPHVLYIKKNSLAMLRH
jgi:hypothetical protein